MLLVLILAGLLLVFNVFIYVVQGLVISNQELTF